MALEYRFTSNGLYGQMAAGFTAAATSIVDSSFAALPVITASAQYMPLSFTDSTAKLTEILWVTAHSSGSNTITVARGKEGTTARAWATGTPWAQAETVRDGQTMATSGSQPTERHVGMRWVDTDTGAAKAQSFNGGIVPQFGAALPTDVGPNRSGATPATGSVVVVRAEIENITTNSVGDTNVQFRTAFPNGCLSVVAGGADYTTFAGVIIPWSEGPSGFDLRAIGFNSGGAFAVVNATFKISYVAIGW